MHMIRKIGLAALLLFIYQITFASPTIQFITIADATRGNTNAVDLGLKGETQGDLFVFDQPLMDANRKKDIGTNSGYCVITKVGVYSQCQWTLTFKNGSTITVAGQEFQKGTSSIPILGGTGEYTNAKGILTTFPNGDGTFTQKLQIKLDHH